MYRRILIVFLAIGVSISTIIGVATFLYEKSSIKPLKIPVGQDLDTQRLRLNWKSNILPPCTVSVIKSCVISLNVFAFNPTGSAFIVASNLPAVATEALIIVHKDDYSFWVVTSGLDADGTFNVSLPGITEVTITAAGDNDPQPDPKPAPKPETEPDPASWENYLKKT